MKIEMSGQCLRCAGVTEWRLHEGWAFHTVTKHWRCSVCNCVTQPEKFTSPDVLAKIKVFEQGRHESVIEIEV